MLYSSDEIIIYFYTLQLNILISWSHLLVLVGIYVYINLLILSTYKYIISK